MPPQIIQTRFRGVALEDLQTSDVLAPVFVPVIGVGPQIPVTPIVQAATDALATAAGVNAGDVYMNTGSTPFRLRINNASTAVSGATNAVNKLVGQLFANVGAIPDGLITPVGVANVPNSVVGDLVVVATVPALPTGVKAEAKVVANGQVAIEIWNLSGDVVSPGAISINAMVLK
jgi:hypothetical protein